MPSQLLDNDLWWHGPDWLRHDSTTWPKQPHLAPNSPSDEENKLCVKCLHVITCNQPDPILPFDRYSSFNKILRITAWVRRFVNNCQARMKNTVPTIGPLKMKELKTSERYWIALSQGSHFTREIKLLLTQRAVSRSSPLIPLNPFIDADGLLRVGGRERNSSRPYDTQHPYIIHGKHPLTKTIILTEHKHLLHAGPSLLSASLSRRFHLIKGRSLIRSITRRCVICRRNLARPQQQMMGQLPAERVQPDAIFSQVGVDYAGPLYVKIGAVRRPTIVKAYVAVYVSLTIKAVHLEAVSDLTTEAILACLRHFVARRGKPQLIWSDHGTNFVGAKRVLTELYDFLRQQQTEEAIAGFCTSQGIEWDFTPERAPHFGGLWEAAVKSFKRHLSRIVGTARLTFEELTTVLTQIEACMNSRPLVPNPHYDDGSQALTPGHFLIGRPLEAIPNPPSAHSVKTTSTLKRWHLCQLLTLHFWKRWSTEYLATLQKSQKWRKSFDNLQVGDVVVVKEDMSTPTYWPLAKIIKTHPGSDGLVRVVTLKTKNGTYTRPIHKIVILLPREESDH